MHVWQTSNLNQMKTLWHSNAFRIIGPLCGESTGHWWLSPQRSGNAELWYFHFCWPIMQTTTLSEHMMCEDSRQTSSSKITKTFLTSSGLSSIIFYVDDGICRRVFCERRYGSQGWRLCRWWGSVGCCSSPANRWWRGGCPGKHMRPYTPASRW